jgi:hypothetical protein
MYLLCDEKRVYVSTNYRVEAYDKPTLVNSEEKHLLWKSEKLKENLNKLVNAKEYIYGIGKNLLVRVGKTDGSTEELVFNEDLVDIFCTYSDLYLLSKTSLFRMPIDKFTHAEIKRLSVSDLMEKPFSCFCASDEYIYLASKSYLYKIGRNGEKKAEKALTDVRILLISEEGPIAIKGNGNVLNMDEGIQVVSSGEFDGEPIKAEYNVYHTFLLTSTGLHVFGTAGNRIAHISDSKYISFAEGLNHLYLYKEDGLHVASKMDILGDNYQNVDLATVSAILWASLMLFEKEKGSKVSVKERHGFLDMRVDETAINMEKLVFKLSKYFPDVFVLFSNIGYYESLLEFATRFELIKREDDNLILNEDMLNHLVKKHSAFETFRKDIVSLVSSCLL